MFLWPLGKYYNLCQPNWATWLITISQHKIAIFIPKHWLRSMLVFLLIDKIYRNNGKYQSPHPKYFRLKEDKIAFSYFALASSNFPSLKSLFRWERKILSQIYRGGNLNVLTWMILKSGFSKQTKDSKHGLNQ